MIVLTPRCPLQSVLYSGSHNPTTPQPLESYPGDLCEERPLAVCGGLTSFGQSHSVHCDWGAFRDLEACLHSRGLQCLHLAGERWAFPWLPHSGPGFMAVSSEGLSFPANTAKVPACGGSASSSECLPSRSFEFYFYILYSVCAPQHTCGSQGVANRNQSFLPSNGPWRPLSGPRRGLSVVAGGYWLVIHASGWRRHCRGNLKKRSQRAPRQKRQVAELL